MGHRKGGDSNQWNNQGGANRGAVRGGRGPRNGRRGGFRHFNARSSRFRNRPGSSNVDEDGDFAMSGGANHMNSRNNTFIRGKNSNPKKTIQEDAWFKVMVPFGACLSENDLFDMIKTNINSPFEPFKYSVEDKRAYFYIKGSSNSEALRAISRRLTKPDGHKLVLHVTPSSCPLDSTVDANSIEKLKLRMSDRYDSSTQLLNLSAFFSDEVLKKENIYLPLNRVPTMAAVTKIIGEHIPELAGIDLSQNKLLSLGHMTDLVKAAPNVTSLNLGDNHLRSLDDLNKLKGWQNMTELIVKGNDFCKNFSNQDTFLSAVRKIFPKVIKLDGVDHPPPITFDLDTDVSLPAVKGSFFGDESVKNLIVTFLKEYYTIFDSDHRKDLLPAYHDSAQMSICAVKNPLTDRQASLGSYFDDSRNLKAISHYEPDKLAKKVKIGLLSVISFLEHFPKTTHDFNSFIVDVTLATPTMLSFVLHGIFKENECKSDKPIIRSFIRSFITVPSGPGMVITNDLLTISNASFSQCKNAFKISAPTPSSSPVSSSQPAVAVPVAHTPEQMAMIKSFMEDSKMTAEYSFQCLQANDWDYAKAGLVFTDMKNQGKIPPEAFVMTAI